MKPNTFLATLLFIVLYNTFSAQTGNVGMGTNDPKQRLHIGGASSVVNNNIGTTGVKLVTPTVRIDGLNKTNNSTVFTNDDTTNPLYVNSNGITGTLKAIQLIENTPIDGDAITEQSAYFPATTTIAGYQPSPALRTINFTLTQRSMVYIVSSISARITNTSGGILSDTYHKSIVARIRITSPSSLADYNLTDGVTYASGTSSSINTFNLSPGGEIVLEPGSYTLVLDGLTIGSTNNVGHYVYFGGDSGDKLNVYARPL